jgi:hypothetical protein
MLRILKTLMALIFIANMLTACYRMPADNEFSLVPTTNNPDITGDRGNSILPSVSY